jgi:hypothetical protein
MTSARHSRIPPLPPELIDPVISLTNSDPPHETTRWTPTAMGKAEYQPILSAAHLEGAWATAASHAQLQAVE